MFSLVLALLFSISSQGKPLIDFQIEPLSADVAILLAAPKWNPQDIEEKMKAIARLLSQRRIDRALSAQLEWLVTRDPSPTKIFKALEDAHFDESFVIAQKLFELEINNAPFPLGGALFLLKMRLYYYAIFHGPEARYLVARIIGMTVAGTERSDIRDELLDVPEEIRLNHTNLEAKELKSFLFTFLLPELKREDGQTLQKTMNLLIDLDQNQFLSFFDEYLASADINKSLAVKIINGISLENRTMTFNSKVNSILRKHMDKVPIEVQSATWKHLSGRSDRTRWTERAPVVQLSSFRNQCAKMFDVLSESL